MNLLVVILLCSASAYAQNSEQVLRGQIDDRPYAIRLLPTASFPNLPQAITDQLNAKHCMIPQTFGARRPENVIHGEFEKKGSSDWAVLCSHDGSTNLLVFFHDAPDKPFTLAEWKDTERLGARSPSDATGSAWGISSVPPEEMQHTPDAHEYGPFDHDGIEDDFLEHSSSIHYYTGGNWLALEGNN